MKQIKCPECGKIITLDENGTIINEVSVTQTQEFKDELDAKIAMLKAQFEANNKAELAEALGKANGRITALEAQKKEMEDKQKAELELAKANITAEQSATIAQLKETITKLQGEINVSKVSSEAAVKDAVATKEAKINELSNVITRLEADKDASLTKLKSEYDVRLKDKDEQIAFYKDLKAKMSTKLVGETLEQHCMNLFNQYRAAMFPNAYFDKDNKVSSESSSKGDFIFKDFDNGSEYISIMFEMKNENDTTATKHKNSDFFKELDKDRREKGCEYAVLVSLLEPESEFYNAGIVDVSYEYPKMYVIRPQCFISMITLLVNAARNSIKYQKELQIVRNQNIDIVHFEDNLKTFQDSFNRNYELASNKFKDAIEGIDKAIERMQKIKEALIGSEKNLRIANDKAQDITIRKLTKNSPTMEAAFDDLKKEGQD